jgi:hypothetical protein
MLKFQRNAFLKLILIQTLDSPDAFLRNLSNVSNVHTIANGHLILSKFINMVLTVTQSDQSIHAVLYPSQNSEEKAGNQAYEAGKGGGAAFKTFSV